MGCCLSLWRLVQLEQLEEVLEEHCILERLHQIRLVFVLALISIALGLPLWHRLVVDMLAALLHWGHTSAVGLHHKVACRIAVVDIAGSKRRGFGMLDRIELVAVCSEATVCC
jgi:hypothetical protein